MALYSTVVCGQLASLLPTVNALSICTSGMFLADIPAKKYKIRVELAPDRARGDAALYSRDFRVSRGEQG